MNQLASKAVIITGGASGMGRTAAHLFGHEGARLALADIDAAAGRQVAEEIQAAGGEAIFVETDLRKEADVASLVEQAMAAYGRVDVLFSNAGVKNALGPAHSIEEDAWDWVFDVNVKGTFYAVKHAVPHMIEQRSGSIIINASVAGFFAMPNQPAYNASKAAELQLARSVAADYGQYNVRCNAICPGPIGGPFATKHIYKDANEASRAQRGVGQIVPLGRMGAAEEVARVAMFLASDAASYVTGATVTIDGGMTLGLDVLGLAAKFGQID